MKDIWNTSLSIIKSIFISVEFIYLIILYIIKFFFDFKFFKDFGEFIFKNSDMVKYIALGLPVSMLLFTSSYHKKIIQPKSNNKFLYEWSDYSQYKINSYIGVIFCIIPIIPVFVSWMYNDIYKSEDIGFYYILMVGISIISTISMYIAHLDINEVIDKNNK